MTLCRKTVLPVALGVALLLAIPATPAPASEFHVQNTGTVTGAQSELHKITVEGSIAVCSSATFTGNAGANTFNSQSLAPVYEMCTPFFFAGGEIVANGCQFVVYANGGTYDLSCPATKYLTVHVEAPFATTCDVAILPQSGINGLSFDATKDSKLVATTNSTNLNYHVTKSTGFCPLTEGAKGNSATYVGETTITAASGGDIWWQ